MKLHQRGVDLLVNVLEAADNPERLTVDDISRLLREVGDVMCLILERDAQLALGREHPAKLAVPIDNAMASALDKMIEDKELTLNREEAAGAALRNWLLSAGYLPDQVEDAPTDYA